MVRGSRLRIAMGQIFRSIFLFSRNFSEVRAIFRHKNKRLGLSLAGTNGRNTSANLGPKYGRFRTVRFWREGGIFENYCRKCFFFFFF